MKQTLAGFVLPLVATPLAVLGSGATAGAGTSAGCQEPVAKRSYNRYQVGYRLDVDLTDCAWWDGSPVRLAATLDRFDVTEGHGAGSFVLCGALHPGGGDDEPVGDAPAVAEAARPSGLCGVEVTLDHPPAEAARYRGEISFPWEDGVRTVGFTALCGPAGGCVDIPFEPTEFLGPAADAYETIPGDADAG